VIGADPFESEAGKKIRKNWSGMDARSNYIF
jgi:hypothetical protein